MGGIFWDSGFSSEADPECDETSNRVESAFLAVVGSRQQVNELHKEIAPGRYVFVVIVESGPLCKPSVALARVREAGRRVTVDGLVPGT